MSVGAPTRRAVFAAALVAAACAPSPKLEELPVPPVTTVAAPEIRLESATVASGRVVVTFTVADGGVPVDLATAKALSPSWTLAALGADPVNPALPAWESLVRTGSQTVACLPPAGPGTPGSCDPLDPAYPGQYRFGVQQPGAESTGTWAELGAGAGRFTYAFATLLPPDLVPPGGVRAGETVRVGVYLRGVTTGTAMTHDTHDFVPNGAPLRSYVVIRDENCDRCHGELKMHGGRIGGVRLCVTCHGWLLADPDTPDPAALSDRKADFPNPLELGRMVHRIHRGKKLPTLFTASSPATWPAVPFTSPPPLPYLNGRNPVAAAGTKYAIVGRSSAEFVFGRVATRVENFQPALTLAEGVGYPQDLRNCDACHAGAPERDAIGTGSSTAVSISRRTCAGCHPDVFYGDPNDLTRIAPLPDSTHLAHTGGPQLDDTACKDCHVVARAGGPKLYAPINAIHRPLNSRAPNPSPKWSRVTAEIVAVQGFKPGLKPTVRFKLSDRNGSITPLDAPTLPMDLASEASPVPRRMTGLSLVVSGPTTDFLTGNASVTTSLLSRNGGTGAYTIATGFVTADDPVTHEFTYVFTKAIPSTAIGVWAIGIEGRRRPDNADVLPPWDPATDTFNWPYTGEAVSEHLTNAVQYVDLATGAITTAQGARRRAVVEQAKCEACHQELNLHGANRHDVAHCLLCHTPDATDWDKRPRDTRGMGDPGGPGTGMVLLHDPVDPSATTKSWGYATVDGIEERSIHFKAMIHRIHVGEREGAASLEGIRPFAVYGYRTAPTGKPSPYFFDDVRFPGKLADCETCHLEDTWTIEAIPAGAAPTTANESGTLLHVGTAVAPASATHGATDPARLPIAAACLSCHTSGAALEHAAGKTSGGVEPCGSCHGESGAESVRKWHAVP